MKKIRMISALLAGCMVIPCVACGGGDDSDGAGTALKLEVVSFDGGIGQAWLEKAISRFEEKVSETKYGPYTGVDIKITPTMDVDLDSIGTSATHIYFDQSVANLRQLIQTKKLANINDIITQVNADDNKSIESKLNDDYKAALKGVDGNYYALPHYEYYDGLSYDIEMFDEMGWYFAAPEETDSISFTSTHGYGEAKFVASAQAKKSCGPDGKYETTYDNGLPSSMQELLILCEKIKADDVSINPIVYCGGHENYAPKFSIAAWVALAGSEEMRNYFNFSGDIEIVDEFLSTKMFDSDVPNATSKTQAVTEATGYYATQQYARYQALALSEIIFDNGWVENGGTNYANTTAMQDFIANSVGNGEVSAMLLEGSYWMNEAKSYDMFNKYYTATGNTKNSRDIGWMPMPTQWSGSVTEGNGAAPTLNESASAYAFINARFESNPNVMSACKDFLQFLYTDAELSHFTGETGVAKAAIDYELTDEDEAKLNRFQSDVWQMKKAGDVVYSASSAQTYLDNTATFVITGNARLMSFVMKGDRDYISVFEALRSSKGYGAKDLFNASKIDASEWSTYYSA